jgi:hypothetical protein
MLGKQRQPSPIRWRPDWRDAEAREKRKADAEEAEIVAEIGLPEYILKPKSEWVYVKKDQRYEKPGTCSKCHNSFKCQKKWYKHIRLGRCEIYERERQGAKQKRTRCDLHNFFGFGGGARDPVDKVRQDKPEPVVNIAKHHVPPGRAAFVSMVVESNISLNVLTKPSARYFFTSYAADAELLRDPRSLRNDILELSEWTQGEVFRMAAGRLVSLIMDGTTWCGRTFYPVILYYIMPNGLARLELAGTFELRTAGR